MSSFSSAQCSLELLDLSLDGMDVSLPSPEEQAAKRGKALDNLSAYVKACGGDAGLPQGWDCALRFRITSRRHGRQGLTTDNYYYSPCGKTFRTHKQVVEFLGLQPLSKEALREAQQARIDAELAQQPQRISIVSVTILEPAARTGSGKRSHSAMTASDSAADSAGFFEHEPQQQQRSAASAPAAMAATSPADSASAQLQQGVSCSLTALPAHSESALSAPAASQPLLISASNKRTKAALAAKYGGGGIVSTAAAAAPTAPSAMRSSCSSATVEATSSCQTGAATGAAACRQQQTPAAAASFRLPDSPADAQQQQQQPARPAASSNAGATVSGSAPGNGAVSSRRPAVQQRSRKPKQQQQQQQQGRAVQPVPKWKPRQPAAWRVKLRELATKAAIEQGLIRDPAAPAAAAGASSPSSSDA